MTTCNICGAEVASGAKFCPECGSPIPRTCINCGAELSLNAKFCPECGAPVTQEHKSGIQLGDANAISADNVVGGNLDIVHGNKEVVHGTKITAETYTVNQVTNEAGFAQNTVNVEELLKKAKSYYEDGNFFKALGIFRELADKDIEALYYIGLCTRDGDGTRQDPAKAEELLEKAASGGLPQAQTALACMYVSSEYGIKDIEKAIMWFEKAADAGESVALENLGEMYLTGYHVKKDSRTAFSYLRQIKKSNYTPQLYFALGNIYYEGASVDKDIANAVKYYQATDDIEYSGISMPEYCAEICQRGLINYANILVNDVDGFGDYDLGVKCLKLAVESFNSREAKDFLTSVEKTVQFRPVTRDGKKCVIDSYGVVFNERATRLIECDEDAWDENTTDYTVPDTVEVIERWAFEEKQIKRINLPSHLKKLDKHAFINCQELESIVIPDSVEEIDDEAFKGCTNLKSIRFNLPSHLKKIGFEAFRECRKLESIDIPDSVEEIGIGAFDDCVNLQSVNIGKNSSLNGNLSEHVFSDASKCELVAPRHALGRDFEHYFVKYRHGKLTIIPGGEKPQINNRPQAKEATDLSDKKANSDVKEKVSSLFGLFRKK